MQTTPVQTQPVLSLRTRNGPIEILAIPNNEAKWRAFGKNVMPAQAGQRCPLHVQIGPAFAGRNQSGNTPVALHFNRFNTSSSFLRVSDCCPFSSRYRVEAISLVFFENSAKVIAPLCLRRNRARCHGSDEEAQITKDTRKGITLKDYARSGKVKNLKRDNHQVSFQTKGQDFWVEELARGDADGDGFEDALLFVTWHYREGSGRGYALQVWSRNKLRPFHSD